jgi:hypothetical protein
MKKIYVRLVELLVIVTASSAAMGADCIIWD